MTKMIRVDDETHARLAEVKRELYMAGNPKPTWSDAIRSEIERREADGRYNPRMEDLFPFPHAFGPE